MVKKVNYEALKGLDVVFTGGKGFLPAIIREVETGENKYNIPTHVGLIIDVHGQKLLVEAVKEGVRINTLKDYLGKKRKWIICIKRHEQLTDDKRELGQKMLAEIVRKGIEYDTKGLFSFLFKFVKQDKNKYFCSELVATIYKYLGLYRGIPEKTNPYDLYKNLFFYTIQE